jgi:hypothetical protein
LSAKLVGKNYDQNEVNQIYAEIRPLAQRLEQGILGEGSLFQKVKFGVLDDEQRAAYRRVIGQRNAFHYRAKLKLFVVALDNLAPMRSEQRESLLKLLVDVTRPPNRWVGGQFDWWYVVLQASEAPSDKLAAVLDDAQLRCFQHAVQHAPQYREVLKSRGIQPFDEDEVLPAVAPLPPADVPVPVFRLRLGVE